MKKLLLIIAFAGVALANQGVQGFCEQGNIAVQTAGLPSTNVVQGSFPSCTVSVFTAGTTNLVTIFADNINTPLSNPFTANSSGRWLFYSANNQRLDIQLSGGGLPSPWKINDVILNDPNGGILNPSNFNGIRIVDGVKFAQTAAGINAADADLGSGNAGEIWVPSGATINASDAQISITSNHLLKIFGRINIEAAASKGPILLGSGAGITCSVNNSSAGTIGEITPSATITSMVRLAVQDGSQTNNFIQGCDFAANTSTVSNGVIDITGMTGINWVRDNWINNFASGVAIFIQDNQTGALAGTSNVSILNNRINANAGSGGCIEIIHSATNAVSLQNFDIQDTACTPGPSLAIGSAFTFQNTAASTKLQQINVTNTNIFALPAGQAGVYINGVFQATVKQVFCSGGTTCAQIANNTNNLSLSFDNIACSGCTNSFFDSANSYTNSNNYISHYGFTATSAGFSGNNVLAGVTTSNKLNGVFYMDGIVYPCTTAGLQAILAAVIAAGGGTADARNCPTMTITSQIDIGNVGGTLVSLELPVGGVWTVTSITDGTSCGFRQFAQSRIKSSGPTNSPFILHAGLATNSLGALYCTASSGAYFNVDNVQFYNPNGAAMANGAMWIRQGADNSNWNFVTVASYGTVGLNITNVCCSATFTNFTSNGNHIAGSIPVQIANASLGLTFNNASIDHPGSGLPIIKIVGPNSTVNFAGTLYMESNSSDTTTALIQITDAGSGSTFSANTITSSPQSVANTAYVISNTGTSQISVQSLQRRGNSSGNNGINEVGAGYNVQTNALNNLTYTSHKLQFGPAQAVTTGEIKVTNTGATVDSRIGAGSFGSSGLGIGTTGGNLPVDFYGNGIETFGIGTDQGLKVFTFYRNVETTAPSGAGGEDRCYADSTSHNIRCNYNNTGFGPLVTAAPCTTSQKTETAADANLLTCAIPAQAGSYRVRFVLAVSAANAATLGWTATWTDSNGIGVTPTNLGVWQQNVGVPAATFTLGGPSELYGSADIDVNNAGTSIVVKLTFSGTSFTGKASATVERII